MAGAFASEAVREFNLVLDELGVNLEFLRASSKLRPRLTGFLNWEIIPGEAKNLVSTFLAEIDGEEWLDRDDSLTDAEKALIETRIEAHEKNPESAIPWEEFETRLKRRLGE